MSQIIANCPAACWHAWRRYWFGPGFELSYAMCRIAIGVLFLYVVGQFPPDIAAHLNMQNPELYQPVGILYLLGSSVPPAEFFTACKVVMAASGFFLIIGLLSRVSLLAGLFAFMSLAGLEAAFEFGWSVPRPPVLLTALGLVVGPTAPYSVDALIRRWRGLPVPDFDRARTAVLLAQFLLASIFLNAAVYKLCLGNHKPFAWCYSDNMHNLLLYQYWVLGQPLPDFLQFIIEHEWAYKGMAAANIAMQTVPIAGCFLVRRPVLRFLCGVAFAMEVYGLGMVMGLWFLHWLLLGVCFIDWDRLARTADRSAAAPATIGRWPALLWSLGVAAFAGVHLYVSFCHHEQRRYTFPFGSFPMYSGIHAQRPYGEHLPYKIFESTWTIDASPPLTETEHKVLTMWCHWTAWQSRDLHSVAMYQKCRLEQTASGRTIHAISLERTVYEIAAFPGYDISPVTSALVYRYQGGQPVSLDLKCEDVGDDVYCELIPQGMKQPRYRVGYQYNFQGPVVELSGQWNGNRFTFTHPCRGKGRSFLVAWVRDESLGDAEVLMGGAILHGGSTAK